ncbi:MAG: hypothetical protein SOU07_06430 [Bacilli bacterium]|nr:hypothetical protein [Acholeplasmataceae bacterium]MDY2903058.1 hypothetical protein [Bacilli bacterium]
MNDLDTYKYEIYVSDDSEEKDKYYESIGERDDIIVTHYRRCCKLHFLNCDRLESKMKETNYLYITNLYIVEKVNLETIKKSIENDFKTLGFMYLIPGVYVDTSKYKKIY